MSEPYYQALDRVERDHWWFVATREVAVGALVSVAGPGSRVLDVGCSTGHVIDTVPATYDRTGVDTDVEALRLARKIRPEISFVEATADAMPFPDASFDAVLAIDLLSAVGVKDDAAVLREAHRVVRPNGTLIVQVGAYEWLFSGHDAATGTAKRYSARALGKLLNSEGFEIQHLTYRVTVPFPALAARRLLRRRRVASDVTPVQPLVNGTLRRLMRVENRLVRRRRLPFGLSVFAVAAARPGS